jgi:hypothetical protein
MYKMNYLKSIILPSIFLLFSYGIMNAQEVSLDIVESTNGCGLATNCAADFICFDIRMTVDIDKDLDSYNIWVKYDNTVLSRINGGDDNSCVIANGGDTDIEDAAGAYRVAGIPGSPFPMTAGNQAIVHTICFSIMDADAVDGSTLFVGGSMFSGALPTSITFADGSTDAVEEVTPLVLTETTISCLILPVEFLSFDVRKIEARKLLLDWVTLSEVNNDHFEIQRSFDGTTFSYINSVKGKVNSNTLQSYSYEDNIGLNIRASFVYYRLKQVDLDGTFDFSDIKHSSLDNTSDVKIQAYPNPFTETIQLNVSDEFLSISIYDVNGQKVIHQNYTPGDKIDLRALSNGTYLIKVVNEIGEEIHSQLIFKTS